jgi:class 3 adenylate cyclase
LPPAATRRPLSHVGHVALLAMAMQREVERARFSDDLPVQMRIGVHTGRVVGGIIGKSRPRYLIWGSDTVLANRMESTGLVGEVQVSEAAARRLVDEGFLLEPFQRVPASSEVHGYAEPAPHAFVNTYLLRSFVTERGDVVSFVPPTRTAGAAAVSGSPERGHAVHH